MVQSICLGNPKPSALVCRQYAGKRWKELLDLQRSAKARRAGLWQGRFESPEEWRRKHRG
jgi:endonuclease YncB( thermonuclease family)